MTADRRAALVEKMRTVFVTSEGDDWHCMGLVLDLIRADVLEEAIECLDKSGCEQGALAIRALKEAPCSSS
jgi:hypothetical protein